MSVCPSIYPSVSVCLSACLSVHQPVSYLPICRLSFYRVIRLFPLRFRRSCFRHVSVAFPLRFRQRFRYVPVAFPSRFRCVSVCISAALPLGKCPPDRNYPAAVAAHWCFLGSGGRANPRPDPFWRSGPDLVSQPAVSGSIPGPMFSERVRRHAADSIEFARQVRCRPKGRTGPNVFQRFRQVSVNVSVAFSSTFPLRHRQRFRYASVGQACARWKLPGNSPSVSGPR